MNSTTERDDRRPYWSGDFKVGDRVRIRVSPECPIHSAEADDTTRAQSRCGTVIPVDPRARLFVANHPDHGICVQLDEPFMNAAQERRLGGCFAATELERVESTNG